MERLGRAAARSIRFAEDETRRGLAAHATPRTERRSTKELEDLNSRVRMETTLSEELVILIKFILSAMIIIWLATWKG